MKPLIVKAMVLASAVSVLAFSVSTAADAAERNRNRTGTFKSNHATGTYDSKITRDRGNLNRSTTWNTDRGTSSSSTNRQVDAETKSWRTQQSYTGVNGRTATSDTTGTKVEGGFNTNRVNTRPDGSTATYNRGYTRDGKSLSMQGTVDTSRGVSGAQTGTYTKVEGGHTGQTVTTFENGKSVTKAVTATHADGSTTRTTTVTGPNGKTKTYTNNLSFNP